MRRHHDPNEIREGLAQVEDLLTPVLKLTADLKAAARHLGDQEARFLVDQYYQMQDQRIRTKNQIRSITAAAPNGTPEPHGVLDWLQTQSETLESQVRLALAAYAQSRDQGQWMLSITGIGPVITAGLLAHIDWTKPTVGHIWRYAGLDPSCQWLGVEKTAALVKDEAAALQPGDFAQLVENCCKRTNRNPQNYYDTMEADGDPPSKANFTSWLARRPFNAELKQLCWKVGESFVKFQNHENDHYGQVYVARKQFEITQNEQGKYALQAQSAQVAKTTDAWGWYNACYPAGTMATYQALHAGARAKFLESKKLAPGAGIPMLPPNHIHSRARRYAVKLFLSHCHFVGLWLTTTRLAPDPYPIAHLGHIHIVQPPNMDQVVGLQAAWDARQRGADVYVDPDRELLLPP